MTLVSVGIPGGFAIRHDRLRELVSNKQIAHYETKENSVIFYLDFMKPNEKKTLTIDVDAFCPGSYRSAPSYAYMYYGEEYKTFLQSVLVANITALQ